MIVKTQHIGSHYLKVIEKGKLWKLVLVYKVTYVSDCSFFKSTNQTGHRTLQLNRFEQKYIKIQTLDLVLDLIQIIVSPGVRGRPTKL